MTESFIIGGYTKRLNEGIHEINFDDKNEKIESSYLISSISNPTYLCLNQERNLLFSLIQENDRSGVIAFRKINHEWQEISRCFASKINGCHINYYEKTQTIYISNYHEGIINVYQFDTDKLNLLQTLYHTSHSRLHFTDVFPKHSILFACDLGNNAIITYKIKKDGQLHKLFVNKTHDEMGPRHFVIHPSLNKMYVIGEYDNRVTSFDITENGQLVENISYPTLPSDCTDSASGAAIKMTKDGNYIYTSTRFSNFISVFKVLENGNLERIQTIDSVGQIPRDFALTEDEAFILVPHQDSDFISIFKRGRSTGELTFINNETELPEAVCIK